MTSLSGLGGWDYGIAVSFATVAEHMEDTPPFHINSQSGKNSLTGHVKFLGFMDVVDQIGRYPRLTVGFQLRDATLTAATGQTFPMSGVIVTFNVPISEFTGDPSAKGNTQVGIDFTNVGKGKGNQSSDVQVIGDQPFKGLPAAARAFVGNLVINAIRNDPKLERMVLATMFDKSGVTRERLRGWRWYAEKTNSQTAHLVCLMSTKTSDISHLPQRLKPGTLPRRKDCAVYISRELFWDKVILPALVRSIGTRPDANVPLIYPLPIAPGTIIQMQQAIWNAPDFRDQSLRGVTDLTYIWADTFAVNFNLSGPLSKVGMNTGMRINFDPITQTLSTSITHKGKMTGQNWGLGGLTAAILPSQMNNLANLLAHQMPTLHKSDFADVGRDLLQWPHITSADYKRAMFSDLGDVKFYFK